MITQSRIIDEYGWTKSLINNFLPEPTLKKNPHYSSAAPMKVWEEDTVKDVMKTPEFQAAMQKATKRKEAANTAVSTKITNMHDNIECFISFFILISSFLPLNFYFQKPINQPAKKQTQINSAFFGKHD